MTSCSCILHTGHRAALGQLCHPPCSSPHRHRLPSFAHTPPTSCFRASCKKAKQGSSNRTKPSMSSTNGVFTALCGITDSVAVISLLAVTTIVLFHLRLSHLHKRRLPAKLPTHLVLVASSCPRRVALALHHLRHLGATSPPCCSIFPPCCAIFRLILATGVPFITLVGLTLDVLAPYLPGLTQLPQKRGESHVEFSWQGAQPQTPPATSRFRWMRAEDGRTRLANRLKHLIINNENVKNMLSDSWPLPCLAVVESTTTCLNGTDTLPIRQADLHFVSKLNTGSVVQCLCAFARGEQRFGK